MTIGRSLWGALLFSAGLALAPALSDPALAGDASTAEALKFARSRYEQGSYADAKEAALAVLEDEPANGAALEILAHSLEAVGDEAGAETVLRAASADSPTASAAVVLLAENLAGRGKLEEAIALFEKAKTDLKRPFRAGAGLAAALLAADRRAEAEKELRTLFLVYGAVEEADLTAGDFFALARAALVAERIPALAKEHVRSFATDARDLFQRSFNRARDQTDLLVAWSRIYADKWDLVEARRLAREALKRNPRHARAHALLAEVLLMDPFGGTAKYEEARDEIEAALATDPNLAEAHVLKAELFMNDGLYDRALEDLDLALASRPLDVRALAARAAILRRRGDLAGAAEIEKRALDRGKLAGAEFCYRFSAVLDARFGYRTAYEYAAKAVEIDPECWPAYSQLGFAAMRVGDEATARKYLEKAHYADPFDLFTFNQLNLLDYLEKEFETTRTERFVLRLHKGEAVALRPYVLALLERAWGELSARYGVTLDTPILVEVFPNLNDFSVRAVAHRFVPASGVTFARVVALASPAAFPPGTHGWGRVLWHELTHVATLERTDYRVPRWLGEGISVYEESKGHRAWVREWDVDLVDALGRGRLLPILELNEGFSKPKFPNQVMLSYYQGGLTCQFIAETWGFGALLKLLDGYRDRVALAESLAGALGGTTAEGFDRRFLAYAREALGNVPYRPPCDDASDLAELRRAVKARPADADLLARYALAAADMKRYADAEATALKLKRLDPLSGDAQLVDALVARHRDAFDEVPKLAAAALARKTRDPLLAETLQGDYYAFKDPKIKKRRDLRRAIAAFESARALFPRHPGYVRRLVELYGEAGETAKRRAALAVLAGLEPDDVETRIELAELARGDGDWTQADRWLEELIWIDPRPPKLHERLAEARLKLGDLAGAEREVGLRLALGPEDPETHALLEAIRTAAGGQAPPAGGQTPPTGGPTAPTGSGTPAVEPPDPGGERSGEAPQ